MKIILLININLSINKVRFIIKNKDFNRSLNLRLAYINIY